MKKTLNVCALLFMLTVLLVSCKKKDDVETTDELIGSWDENPRQSINRRLNFLPGGKFSLEVLGTDGYAQLTVDGKYEIQAGNLNIDISSTLERQPSGKLVITKTNYRLFEKATYNVKNLVLTIDYTSYPADAPIPTQVKFNKIQDID